MKRYFTAFKLIVLFSAVIIGFSSDLLAQTDLPVLNKKVIEFCESNVDRKVGRGECWDLAKFALEYANANHPETYVFGKKLNPTKETILPGDIVQFENVQLKTDDMTMQIDHHTAIVYAVIKKDNYQFIHQNINGVRKVMITAHDLSNNNRGSIKFYRPIPQD